MKPYYSEAGVTLWQGDNRAHLKHLPDGAFNTCVTSPPYFGLRDYGHADQIGLESTPEAYVAEMVGVFREVRRCLRDDGTLWLNIGDSYNAYNVNRGEAAGENKNHHEIMPSLPAGYGLSVKSLKPKDMIGIPWRLAFALQQPYYAGKIVDERYRIWLAAMLDAEGCLFIHKRKVGQNAGDGYTRQSDTFSPGLEISNTHQSLVTRCAEIAGVGSVSTQDEGRRQRIYRWTVRAEECRKLVRELYPYIIGKQHQARLAYGCPTNGGIAEAAHAALKARHAGSTTDVDFPAPPSLFESGYYLRSDVIWAKPNPMPESVTDRPTKAHEYIFLLSKSARYYYDYEAVRERGADSSVARLSQDVANQIGSTRANGGAKTNGNMKAVGQHKQAALGRSLDCSSLGSNDEPLLRNRRSVWTVAPAQFKGAHFATFPEDLIRPCILAGAPVGGAVLEPFAGSGTTLKVARDLGLSATGIELNPGYCRLVTKRLAQGVLFHDLSHPTKAKEPKARACAAGE